MFLVAAVDTDQMFYHLATVPDTNIVLDANIASKVETLIILAIGQEGILERREVEVEQGSCQSSQSSQSGLESEVAGRSSWSVPNTLLASLSFILLLVILALATFICNLRRRAAVSH